MPLTLIINDDRILCQSSALCVIAVGAFKYQRIPEAARRKTAPGRVERKRRGP